MTIRGPYATIPVVFTFRIASTDREKEEIYRLRYQVYCLECGYESPEDYPDGLETDEYDRYSVHFLAVDGDQNVVGTVRLILHSELGFPIEKHCRFHVDVSKIPHNTLAEISRLAISKMYRRRAYDRLYGESELHMKKPNLYERRHRHEILLGLLKVMYRESKWLGLTHWYAVMEDSLFELLKRYGFLFNRIGEKVDYHGIRAPYVARIGNIESLIARTRPELFQFFTDWKRLITINSEDIPPLRNTFK